MHPIPTPPVRKKAKLRDYLSLHRTVLSNERTLLSYIRTCLALYAFGVTYVKIFEDRTAWIIGSACLLAGTGVLSLGLRRFQRVRSFIRRIKKEGGFASDKA